MTKRHIGSSLDDFLEIAGTYDQAQAVALIETRLLEGKNSAESTMTAADWKTLREEACAIVKARDDHPEVLA